MMVRLKNTNFNNIKNLFSINNIDINKIVVSNKVSFGKKVFKYFIDYKNAKRNKPLCISLEKMSAYRRDFYETKFIFFFIKNDELLEKCNEI